MKLMNFSQLLKKIESSQEFKDFKTNHPSVQLIAGFFIIDLIDTNNQQSLDYSIDDEIFTFSIDDNRIIIKEDKLIEDPKFKKLTPINKDIKIDTDQLLDIVIKETQKNKINNKLQKIIAVLQKLDNQQVWNLTCMLDGLLILNIIIDSQTELITKFERHSMMDFIKKS